MFVISNGNKAIRKSSFSNEFSFPELFGHLFSVEDSLKNELVRLEKTCKLLSQIHFNLLFDEKIIHNQNELIHAKTILEQDLSFLFNISSKFWEIYYWREYKSKETLEKLKESNAYREIDIDLLSKWGFPQIFTILDCMHFASNELNEKSIYELIQISTQFYLKAQLLTLSGYPNESNEAIAKALQIVGPINAKQYKNYIQQLLTN